MRLKHFYKIVLLLIVTGFSVSCSKNDDESPQLSVSVKTVSFESEADTSEEITIEANSAWSISNSAASWLQLSKASGNSGTTATTITVVSNETGFSRSVVLTVEANNGQARRITITQKGSLYPTYNLTPKAPDETGMSSTAVQLAAKMEKGINFGNTMESPVEGEWQTSKLTPEYVKFVKQMGFNTVRLPTNWVWTHLKDEKTMKIDPVWLARVKEVVKWCVDNDMYVMLNTHGDNGWLENNVNAANQEVINQKLKAIWQQIATEMRDFDEHLIFAGMNEPAVDTPEQMAILNGFSETFIKAVRSTGGRNSYRVLVVQGPSTDPNKTADLMTMLPKDNIPNKLMVEVHDYTPATFTLLNNGDATWGQAVYYWGKDNHSIIEPSRNATPAAEEVLIDIEMQNMKKNFVDKGIPVLLGEYASWRRTAATNGNYLPMDLVKHNQSVEYWAKYVTKQAKANGIIPFWWEIGFLFDRKNNTIKDQAMYDAIMAGYN